MTSLIPRRAISRNLTYSVLCSQGRSASLTLRVREKFHRRYSSNTSESQVRYQLVEYVESLYNYCAGGYHPVCINDRLHERYRIVHKLGYGNFSTIWLATDEKTSKYVAIKVCTTDANRTELRILSQLMQSAASYSNSKDCLPLLPVVLDHFDIHGPNGTHNCLVTLPAMCSLRDAKGDWRSGLLQLETARSLAAQLTKAVCFLHSQGYAHGDLHLGNLLLQLPSPIDDLSAEQLYLQYGEPDRQQVVREDTMAASIDPGVPAYVVPPVWLGKTSSEIGLGEARLMLSDFGTAFRPSEKSRFDSYIPHIYRPPEALFEPTTPLTFASDVWTLGCVIFELFAQRELIDGHWFATRDEMTAQQVKLQGIMPPEWWAKWEERPKWFDEVGNPLRDDYHDWAWERRFEEWVQEARRHYGYEPVGDEERDTMFELLKWMLAWRPNERPHMKQVLESEWMTRWGLPTYQKGLQEQ